MLESTRLKLTAWYLVILMVISGFFSFLVYQNLTAELDRGLRMQALRVNPRTRLFDLPTPSEYAPEVFEEARQRILVALLGVNGIIWITAGIASYFLAGRTLKPIEIMIDEQKRFIADASHELRTPLTAIKTEIEVSLRDKKLTLPDAKSLLKSNLEETDKMQKLSNYLLALSRYQDDKRKLDLQKFDLASLVLSTSEKFTKVAKAKGIALETKTESAFVVGNADSLAELTSILVDNAIKYTRSGGKVDVKVVGGKHAYLEVSDTGIGIKAGDLPHIFDRFYRADTSRAKVHTDGYGLGLAIAKSIADLNNAKISVTSSPTVGSTFKVAFS